MGGWAFSYKHSSKCQYFTFCNNLAQFTDERTELRDNSWDWRWISLTPICGPFHLYDVPLAQSFTLCANLDTVKASV